MTPTNGILVNAAGERIREIEVTAASVAYVCTDTHEITVWDNGTLDIIDNASVSAGNEDSPIEYVRLDLASMRELSALLQDPTVQALLNGVPVAIAV